MKFFQEKDLKKIALGGVITVLLIGLIGTSYHRTVVYDQKPKTLTSENIVEGELLEIHNETKDTYEFEAKVSEDVDDYEIFINLTSERRGESENYTMEKKNNSKNMHEFVFEAKEGEFYEHHFALKINESNKSKWEKTESVSGPVTVGKTDFLINVFLNFISISLFISFSIILYKWLKEKRKEIRK
ncbi:MAG: hypothetical protein ACOC5D_04355 [Thermoplasmatota archaeon]